MYLINERRDGAAAAGLRPVLRIPWPIPLQQMYSQRCGDAAGAAESRRTTLLAPRAETGGRDPCQYLWLKNTFPERFSHTFGWTYRPKVLEAKVFSAKVLVSKGISLIKGIGNDRCRPEAGRL